MKAVKIGSMLMMLTVTGLAGCRMTLNSSLKEISAARVEDDGTFKRPVYPEKALDQNADPSFVLIADLRVSTTNVTFQNGQVTGILVDQLTQIRNQFPNSIFLLVGGVSTYNTETTLQNRALVASHLAGVMAKFQIISRAGALGPDDPADTASDNGAARICAALNGIGTINIEGLPSGQAATVQSCLNDVSSHKRMDSVIAAGNDYDFGHARPLVMDTRAETASGRAYWRAANALAGGLIDSSTQLHFLCDQTFKNQHSWMFSLGQPWSIPNNVDNYVETPPELGSQRLSPLIMAANPFNGLDFEGEVNSSLYLRNAILNHAGIPIVFVKNRTSNPGTPKVGGLGTPGGTIDQVYSVPAPGGRSLWVAPVASLNGGTGSTPAFTAVYLGRKKALIKHFAVTSNPNESPTLIASSEHALSTPVNFNWKTQPAASTTPEVAGSFPVCCAIDRMIRPASATSTTLRQVSIGQLLVQPPETQHCGTMVLN